MNSPRMQCTTPHHKHDWEMGDYPDDWRCGWCGNAAIKERDALKAINAELVKALKQQSECSANTTGDDQ